MTIRAASLAGTALDPTAPAVVLVLANVHAPAIAAALGVRITGETAGATLIPSGFKVRPAAHAIAAEP